MNTEKSGLASLSRAGSHVQADGAAVPRPPIRWSTRVALPLAILLIGGGLLGYSARAALRPAITVQVTPVVAKSAAYGEDDDPEGSEASPTPAARAGSMTVQAPGWIEPAPFAASIPALTEGVVREVLVLEGERVEAGQVVARLIDEDANLRLRRSEAELAEAEAMAAQASAEADAAAARVDEVQQELDRRRPLSGTGVVAEGEVSQLERRLQTAKREVAVAAAATAAAEARAATHRVLCEEARLALSRTEIVSPVGGVVLSRSIEPGVRIAMAPPGAGAEREVGVMRVYDPAKLQVRVDVPLVDAAKVGLCTRAEISTEALPDRTFLGDVVRVVHEADIQRNTVQFKVAIQEPSPELKPEMLTKVRFTVGGTTGAVSTGESGGQPDGLRLFVAKEAIVGRSSDGRHAKAWVADQSGNAIEARLREVTLGASEDGYLEVLEGLKPGDRVVIDPPAKLRDRTRIKLAASAGAVTKEGW